MGQSMSTVSPDTVGTVPRPSRDRDLSSPTSATPTELFASSPRQAAEDSAALRKRMTANQLQAMDTESESSSNVASSLGKRRTDATVDGGGQDATFDNGGMANLSPNYTEPLQTPSPVPQRKLSSMPDTVLDVQKVDNEWVVLLEDERLLVVDEDFKKVYFDIKDMGQPNQLDRSGPCYSDYVDDKEQEWRYLVTLSRRPQYSKYKPYVLVTENSEQNRHLAIFDTRNRKMVFHEKMRADTAEEDALLVRPYQGSIVSPKTATIFRALAPSSSVEAPIILEIAMSPYHNFPRILSIKHKVIRGFLTCYKLHFNNLQNLYRPYVMIEREAIYDGKGEEEQFILIDKLVLPFPRGHVMGLAFNIAVDNDEQWDIAQPQRHTINMSHYCGELCAAKLHGDGGRKKTRDFFVTDMVIHHDYTRDLITSESDDTNYYNNAACCFIGGSQGIIYVADLTLWKLIPPFYIAVMMVENITFDLLCYNSRKSILIARGTHENGRVRWYLFNMDGILKRIYALFTTCHMEIPPGCTFKSFDALKVRAKRDLIQYMVVASSVFDFGPGVVRCYMDSQCSAVQITTLHSCKTITYARGSFLEKIVRMMKAAVKKRSPACKISRILTEELILEILFFVSRDATFCDRWEQLHSQALQYDSAC